MQRGLKVVAGALDALGLGVCVFDFEDRTLFWNQCFLKFFPEHAGYVHVGEPYTENLRRFYAARIRPADQGDIPKFIAEGLARHQTHDEAYVFSHRDRQYKVVARTILGVGRMRIWLPEEAQLPRTDGINPLPRGMAGEDFFSHMAEGLVVLNHDGTLQWANAAFLELYRIDTLGDVIGRTFLSIYRSCWDASDHTNRELLAHGLAVLEDAEHFDGVPCEVPLPNERWTQVRNGRNASGAAYATHVDVTPLKRQQARLLDVQDALRRQSDFMQAVFNHMDQGVMLVSENHEVELCNQRAIELEGLPEALVHDRPHITTVMAYQHERGELSGLPDALLSLLRTDTPLADARSFDRPRPNGQIIEVCNIPIRHGGTLRTFTDVTERRSQEARLRHVGSHDGLTQLVNRDTFIHKLQAALCACSRRHDGVAVHFIDLDRFKPVNDTLGHAVGDRVLLEVANRLRLVARESDVVGRMGGDEFAILQMATTDHQQARGLAERALAALRHAISVDTDDVFIEASIGIALYPGSGTDAATLLKNADRAMYIAKSTGTAIRVYETGDTSTGRALDL